MIKLLIANTYLLIKHRVMKWNLLSVTGGLMTLSLLASCSNTPMWGGGESLEEKHKAEQKKKNEGLAAYQKVGGKVNFNDPNMVTVTGGVQEKTNAFVGVTSEEDTVWAPEDPDEPMEKAVEEVWNNSENKSWHTNMSVAAKLARNSGKPIIVWFTNSEKSPQCKLLNTELVLKPEFEKWAKDNTVRVTLDVAKRGGSIEDSERVQHAKKFKERYDVLGYPSVYVLSPSGEVVDKQRGYKTGSGVYYWGRIRHSVDVAAKHHGAWREKLEKRGYRMWTSREGAKVFAKLNRYKDNKVTLVEPDGKRGSTSFRKLSDADQTWINQEKAKYDAKKESS